MKQPHKRIETRDNRGIRNGYLVPILEQNGSTFEYLTVVTPGMVKGPHLHKKRAGHFTCLSGNVRIVIKSGDQYLQYLIGEDCGFATVTVPPGEPCAIHNIGKTEAKILNRPTPPWRADEYDEHTPASFVLDQPDFWSHPCRTCNGTTYRDYDGGAGFCGACRTKSGYKVVQEIAFAHA